MRALVVTLVLLGCSSQHAADKPRPEPLSVADDGGRRIVALTPNDELTDGAGRVVGRVDWKAPQVIVGEIKQALVFEIEPAGISVVSPMGPFHTVVRNGEELSVNGKRVGKLDGFASTKDGWRNLAAVVLAIPMLPTPTPDAAVDMTTPAPPPPPPPPPPSKP